GKGGGGARELSALGAASPGGPPLDVKGVLLDAAFSPDALQVAAAVSLAASAEERIAQPGQQPGQIQLWDRRAGKLQHEPLPVPAAPRRVGYSPRRPHFAVTCAQRGL